MDEPSFLKIRVKFGSVAARGVHFFKDARTAYFSKFLQQTEVKRAGGLSTMTPHPSGAGTHEKNQRTLSPNF